MTFDWPALHRGDRADAVIVRLAFIPKNLQTSALTLVNGCKITRLSEYQTELKGEKSFIIAETRPGLVKTAFVCPTGTD